MSNVRSQVRFGRKFVYFVATLAAGYAPAFALESQFLQQVQLLPPQVSFTLPCGRWSVGDSEGYYRLVIASVSAGAGSETYLQRIKQPVGNALELELVETVAFPGLNNDHNQYEVSSASCKRRAGQSFVELFASFEHDTADVAHRIRIQLEPPYRVSSSRVRGRRP